MIKSAYWFSCKVTVIIVYLILTLIFVMDFHQIKQYQISWKSFRLEPICSWTKGGANGRSKKYDEVRSNLFQFSERTGKRRIAIV